MTHPLAAIVRDLLAQNLSFGLIAEKLKTTRSAVAGIARRNSLKSQNPVGQHRKPRHPGRILANASLPVVRGTAHPFVDKPQPVDATFPHRTTLLDLRDDSCRFPIGDPALPAFFFCGAPGASLANNRPYCPAHDRLTHRG